MSQQKSKADQALEAVQAIAEAIRSTAVYVVGWGIVVLIAAAVLKPFGISSRWLPTMGELQLVYVALAFWLYRGGKL